VVDCQAFGGKYQELLREKEELELRFKEAHNKFKQLKAITENIIQSMTTGLIITDLFPRKIRFFNKAMERISSISAKEAIGRTIEEVLGERQGIPYQLFYKLTEEQGRVEKMDLKIVRKDGHTVYRRVKVETLYDQTNGKKDGLLIFAEDLNETEFIKEAFSRFVPQFILEQAIRDGYHIKLDGKLQEVSILIVDIREFSALTEDMTPEEIVSLLNRFFQAITDIVFRYHGWVDKFMGDSLMALFGVPIYQEDSAFKAVSAALEIKKSLRTAGICQYEERENEIQVGIGINTGPAVIGNMGSEHRVNYTAIGDAVNLAFRLQDMARKGEILIGEDTYEQVKDKVITRALGPVRVKGRRSPLKIYALEDGYDFYSANLA
jgi:PAS domain S-box-containing protein